MTAAVAIPPPPSMTDKVTETPAEARKRRREILASQRSSEVAEVSNKKRKVPDEVVSAPSKPTKKPQMKYDPDVPMTKEQAATWRREQRRKRNRESAAASRQRQRDRISELESEVEEWKTKFDAIMKRLKLLERNDDDNDEVENTESSQTEEPPQTFVSPTSSPSLSPRASPPTVSPVVSLSVADNRLVSEKGILKVGEEQHLPKMISQQA